MYTFQSQANLTPFVTCTKRKLQESTKTHPITSRVIPFEVKKVIYFPYRKEHGVWSTEGCKVVQRNHSTVMCYCDHLTSFAVLTRVTPNQVKHWPIFTRWRQFYTHLSCYWSWISSYHCQSSCGSTRRQLIDWLINWLIDWSIDRLINWLTDWLLLFIFSAQQKTRTTSNNYHLRRLWCIHLGMHSDNHYICILTVSQYTINPSVCVRMEGKAAQLP